MRKEIIIRMQPDSDKGRNNALKVAASVSGVQSVTVTGSGKDLLLVIGDGVDEGKLIRKLKKEVREAEIVELRTLPGGSGASALPPGAQSPYQRHPTPGRSVAGGGRIECPVAAAAARWPGEHSGQAVSYYHRTPSPGYYQHYAPSPMAAQGGYGGYAGDGGGGGSLYAREVARSHPAHYSPMIARHDSRAVDRSPPGRREHGGGEPNCCSIL